MEKRIDNLLKKWQDRRAKLVQDYTDLSPTMDELTALYARAEIKQVVEMIADLKLEKEYWNREI